MNAIQTDSLTKYYGKSRGITDVSLTVEEGDFFGFIGPNGAGKSTTIRTLLGLIAPTEGSAKIFGKDIRSQKEAILSETGYMPSEAAFYPHMRVREVIKLSADLRKKDCRKEAAKLCERLALDTGKKIRELSLGNRKKVSIICALQHKPKLCILDEPTSGLDPLIQREFFALLEEQNAAGTTIFLSSHVLSEVQRHCRHAAIIRSGRLLLSDSIENLGHTDAKRVTVRGSSEPPSLENIPYETPNGDTVYPKGIKDVTTEGNIVTFLYRGDAKALLTALAALPLMDVTIADPDLEEIFMHYYSE